MSLSPQEAVARICRRQHGIISRHQALAAGVSPRQFRWFVDSGRWRTVFPNVICAASTDLSREGLLLGATQSSGGVASHRSAMALFGSDGARFGVPEVTICENRRVVTGRLRLHYSRDLVPAHMTTVGGIACTTAARTIVDLGAVSPVFQIEKWLDDLIRRRLVTEEEVWDVLLDVARQGRTGVVRVRELLLARMGKSVPGSWFNRRVGDFLARAGLPQPTYEHPVGRYFLDVSWPEYRAGLELQSVRFHTNRRAFQRDAEKRRAMKSARWDVDEYTFRDFTVNPQGLLAQTTELLIANGWPPPD